MAGWGYRQVAPLFFVRDGAPRIDAAALGREVERYPFRVRAEDPPPDCDRK